MGQINFRLEFTFLDQMLKSDKSVKVHKFLQVKITFAYFQHDEQE